MVLIPPMGFEYSLGSSKLVVMSCTALSVIVAERRTLPSLELI